MSVLRSIAFAVEKFSWGEHSEMYIEPGDGLGQPSSFISSASRAFAPQSPWGRTRTVLILG